MAINEKKEELKSPEQVFNESERAAHFRTEQEKNRESNEISRGERIISAELRREIEMMELDDDKKDEAKKKANKIEFLGEKEKIEHLLQIAREKGLVFAIQVAKKMGDPYVLDILHDTLAQEGFYKDFTK